MLAFRVFVGVLVWGLAFVRSVAKFKLLAVALVFLSRSVMRSGVALVPSVMGELLRVYPLPYYIFMRVRAVLLNLSDIKIIYSNTI